MIHQQYKWSGMSRCGPCSTPLWERHFADNLQPLSEACTSCLTHENTRNRLTKQVKNTSAIQSVHANIQSNVMSVTDSQTENNKMSHYHNFPDLDEWVSHCGSKNGAEFFQHSLSHLLALSVCISVKTFLILMTMTKTQILIKVRIYGIRVQLSSCNCEV